MCNKHANEIAKAEFKFQVGDVVRVPWSRKEYVLEHTAREYNDNIHPLGFRDGEDNMNTFTLEGRHRSVHELPILFLVRRPKKKVTKTLTRWVNLYPNDNTGVYTYDTKQAALAAYSIEHKIATLQVTGTYEVEE